MTGTPGSASQVSVRAESLGLAPCLQGQHWVARDLFLRIAFPGTEPNMLSMDLNGLENGKRGQLGGQMLVAMPGMRDERFQRSVIYICGHSADGAMGIVINNRTPSMTFRDLLVQLDLIEPDQAIRLPRRVSHAHVLRGGPVETSRGFVLHTPDFTIPSVTQEIDDGVCMTDRNPRHPARDRARRGAAVRDPGARLRGLERRPAGARDRRQRLAALRGRSGASLQPRPRQQVRPRLAKDRHRPGHAVGGGRAGVEQAVTSHSSLPCKGRAGRGPPRRFMSSRL